MSVFPNTPPHTAARIRRYEASLHAEQREHGTIMDRFGKRSLLGALYLQVGDTDGALKQYRWFARTFSDDAGEPWDYLCWSLALHRAGRHKLASKKLLQTMLRNLYLIPALLGEEQVSLEIRHGSSGEDQSFADATPPELFALWSPDERAWLATQYHSRVFQSARTRAIEIDRAVMSEPVGAKRSALVEERWGMGDAVVERFGDSE